jgi:hypothetical protein
MANFHLIMGGLNFCANSPLMIAETLQQAFLETHYHVHDEPPFFLQIGQTSEALLACHARHQVTCSAFITAWNPLSQMQTDAVNAQRHQELVTEVERRSLSFLPGVGQHPSNQWPGEGSLLVLGLSLEAAKVLGQWFEQHALVWAGEDCVPELIMISI